jgi:hypothetical protein
MPITCLIYGLGVQVNVPIAGMRGLPVAPQVDVIMELGSMSPELRAIPAGNWQKHFESSDRDSAGLPLLTVDRLVAPELFYRITYRDGTVITVDGKGTRVWATWPETATVEDTATYLLGPILGFVLRLRGTTCLHGSAVVIDNQAIALVGPSGAGKSSTAAAFARMGFRVLTDDVVALEDLVDTFYVQPAYPRIRLWPEAVRSMFGSVDALPLLTPNWEKRFLDTLGPPSRFQSSPLPLAAIYFLADRNEDNDSHDMADVSPKDSLMTLVSDTYITYLLDKELRAQEFELLGRLVRKVRLRKLSPSSDMLRIEALCREIVDDFRGTADVAAA